MVLIFLQVVENQSYTPSVVQPCSLASTSTAELQAGALLPWHPSLVGHRLMLVPVSSPALGMPSPKYDPVWEEGLSNNSTPSFCSCGESTLLGNVNLSPSDQGAAHQAPGLLPCSLGCCAEDRHISVMEFFWLTLKCSCLTSEPQYNLLLVLDVKQEERQQRLFREMTAAAGQKTSTDGT